MSEKPAMLRCEASSHPTMRKTPFDGRNRTKKISEEPCDASEGQPLEYYLIRPGRVKFCLFSVHLVTARFGLFKT
jgi:hypothetical protein